MLWNSLVKFFLIKMLIYFLLVVMPSFTLFSTLYILSKLLLVQFQCLLSCRLLSSSYNIAPGQHYQSNTEIAYYESSLDLERVVQVKLVSHFLVIKILMNALLWKMMHIWLSTEPHFSSFFGGSAFADSARLSAMASLISWDSRSASLDTPKS